jgi:hypothetical protein
MIDILERYNIETTNTCTHTPDLNRIYFEAKMAEDEAAIMKLSVSGLHLYLRDIEGADPF